MKNVSDFVQNVMCVPHDHELLYLSKFGSHLYGTHTTQSDIDYKGIFLPSKTDLLLDYKIKSLHYSSSNDESRNNNQDIDIDLWTLQYFLELVKKGETNAIDLLFSITNKDCVVYYNKELNKLFFNPLRLFNPRNCNAFVYYSKNQIKKYGSASSRLGILKQVCDYLENRTRLFDWDVRLSSIAQQILDNFYDSSYCFMKIVNGEEALVVCSKVHLFSIKLTEFYNRIKTEFEKYGQRVRDAYENNNVDWKAVSHAMRCLIQMEELLTYGDIQYPLKDADFLLNIKQGCNCL